MSDVLFYRFEAGNAPASAPALAQGCVVEAWRPSRHSPLPPGPRSPAALVWLLFHALHIFANRSYGAVLVRAGGRVVHRSFVFPRYFRFPFMQAEDLQVGDTWTDPAWRGRGLASAALWFAVHEAGRRVWYLTELENPASIRVAERCGFVLWARGQRTARWGLHLLGEFLPDLQQKEAS